MISRQGVADERTDYEPRQRYGSYFAANLPPGKPLWNHCSTGADSLSGNLSASRNNGDLFGCVQRRITKSGKASVGTLDGLWRIWTKLPLQKTQHHYRGCNLTQYL
jgi:hypothetical protein